MIPKRIISIWIGPEMPEVVKKSLETHKIPDYEHMFINNVKFYELITFDHSLKNSVYLRECLENKEWVRAADFLRLWALNKYGGIYLDADAELLPNVDPFEGILENHPRMFVFKEASGYINNGYIGSEPNHPFLKYLLNTIDHSFRTDKNLFWTGMQFFAESYYIADRVGLGMEIFEEEARKEIIIHHDLNSWVKNEESD